MKGDSVHKTIVGPKAGDGLETSFRVVRDPNPGEAKKSFLDSDAAGQLIQFFGVSSAYDRIVNAVGDRVEVREGPRVGFAVAQQLFGTVTADGDGRKVCRIVDPLEFLGGGIPNLSIVHCE